MRLRIIEGSWLSGQERSAGSFAFNDYLRQPSYTNQANANNPSIAKARPSLQHGTQEDPKPGPQSDLGGLAQLPAMPEFAQQRAYEGSGEQTDRPTEEQSGEGAYHGAKQCLPAGAHALGPDHGREEIHRQRQQGEQPKRPPG